MSLEIFPQNLQLFPDDRQLFTARAINLEPMWTNVRATGLPTNFPNGVVDPDYSVRRTHSGGSLAADGALELSGGVGAIEYKLAANCISFSATLSALTLSFFFDGTTAQAHDYTLFFYSGKVEIKVATVLQATIVHTFVAGDIIRVELANGFRLFINGALQHERVSFSSSIQYPGTYAGEVNANALAGEPTIPAPRLSGAWRLRPVVRFTTPTHGSISTAGPALSTEYFDGDIPGVYKLLGQILPGVEAHWEDNAPAGSTVNTTGGTWTLTGLSDTPAPTSGIGGLRSPASLVGSAQYDFQGATKTLQINNGDIMSCLVFLDAADPPTEIMLQWGATDATGFEHRAYWGANSIALGTDGTPTRRFMGALPATGQWVRLEVPASLVDLEGRVLNGGAFDVFDGRASFDQFGRFPGKIQRFESVITIPGLQILGESPRTMQPSTKARLQTNYDVAQTALVTWSVVSGSGSFSGNEFTADDEPGTAVVRASGPGNQIADLTINVPAIITPSFAFAAPLEVVDFGTNIPATVTWSSVPSGINSSTGIITFPNTPGATVKITASNGTFTATRDILLLPKFPIGRFATPMEGERRKKVLISEAEDGTDVSRVKNKDGLARDYYSVQIKNLIKTEFDSIMVFYDENHPAKPFIFEDVPRGIRMMAKFDSDIAWRGGPGRFDVAFRVKQVAI